MKGRPPALTPDQQEEVQRRLAGGESASALAAEFKVGRATIQRLSGISGAVRNVAEKVAEAHRALATLPPAHQHIAVSLAEKLRSISASLASAAELGAKTSHRLQALANSEMAKVQDSDPLKDRDRLQGVAALVKMANDAAVTPVNLLNASKDAASKAVAEEEEETPEPQRERIGLDAWKQHHGLA